MTNITQEVPAAPRLARVQYQPAATSNHFFINTLLFVVSIPAAIITVAILLAMIPFRIPEMFTR
ncbi:MAG TPA: hypothetical protein PK228_08620 [Saprospiraceae bacterium]|nr:hypothetical protein [Saprospiraceae bacterium]